MEAEKQARELAKTLEDTKAADVKDREVTRIMSESLARFNHEACAREYIKLYEKMLDRPLVKKEMK